MKHSAVTNLQQQLLTAIDTGQLSGQLKINEPMSRYTTWRIGGMAECFYQPGSIGDLQSLLKLVAPAVPVYWIGLGSNLLIRDNGLKGLVINTNGVLNQLNIRCETQSHKTLCYLQAEAGLSCAVFSRKAARQGLNGAEFLSGIPGTIGGALAMNAGAFGGETWRQVISVDMIDRHGNISHRSPEEFNINYRHVEYKNNTQQQWFIRATFCYEQNEVELQQSKQEIKNLLKKRARTQPTTQANAGSVFKNPPGDHAARLIEDCGLKGKSINGAQVSEKHANFIINTGRATAGDVEALIELIQERVLYKHGIKLQTEVHFMGDK